MRVAGRVILVAVLLATLSLATQGAQAAGPLDYAIADGRFYAQAVDSGQSGRGFRITDEGGIPFWSEFQRMGGVRVLGYPISGRFVLDGLTSQAMQRGILQWQPAARTVTLVNMMDYLSTKPGADEWLASKRGVPRSSVGEAKNEPWGQAVQSRMALMDGTPAIKTFYQGQAEAMTLYGLPCSTGVDRGDFVAMRFQRGTLQLWKKDVPWAKAGEVTAANVGDLAKELGIIPSSAVTPEGAPPAVQTAAAETMKEPVKETVQDPPKVPTVQPTKEPVREAARDQGGRVSGLATWYGQPYHGRLTSSGEVFNMYDPTTAAANIFPMGAWLRVTRVDTGASVTVRVNDRGGFQAPYIVDLSMAAYQKLTGSEAMGSVQVVVEQVSAPGN